MNNQRDFISCHYFESNAPKQKYNFFLMYFLSENLIPNVYAGTHMALSCRQMASQLFLAFFNQHIFHPSSALSVPCKVSHVSLFHPLSLEIQR